MSKHPNRNWGIFALVAVIFGYLAGILTAPKSGKETREDIKSTANLVVSEAEKKLKSTHAELGVVLMDAKKLLESKGGDARVELTKALESAKETQQKVKVLLTSLRDGGAADNPELDLAVKEAKSALDHLKKYMK